MQKFKFIKPNKISLTNTDVVDELSSAIDSKKLLGIGEVHGVKDNVDLYFTVFEKFGFDCIALEYPVDCHSDLLSFLKTGELTDHWFFSEINDGRFNHEMLSMLKILHESGQLKKIICYDKRNNTTVWNERDKDYADAFLENYDENLKTLVTGGGHHLKTETFELPQETGNLYPMGYHLKETLGDFPTAKIIYTSGEFFNFGKQSFQKLDQFDENIRKIGNMRYEFVLEDVRSIEI